MQTIVDNRNKAGIFIITGSQQFERTSQSLAGRDQIEIKSGRTVSDDFYKGLNFFSKINKDVKNSYILYGGNKNYSFNTTRVMRWRNLDELEV